jgi:glyoxylase-like metal-dependent hydrolase (beta-lactamase superfamily II)
MKPSDSANTATASSARAPAVTAEGEAFPSGPKRLRYTDAPTPAAGESVQIAPGVRWGRIPLPMDLNHINVWLIEIEGGSIIVDTGMAASMGKDAWERIAHESFAARPLRGVFVTHIHPDHIGLAAWLQARYEVPVWMSERTYMLAQAAVGGGPGLSVAESFFRANGVDDGAHLLPMFKPERFIRMTSGLPRVTHFVRDDDPAPWSSEWSALETNGHAEGHLCLWNAAERVLISGDQVLPSISSNISFNFRSSDANPLHSYLSSLRRLRELPADTLVLPSHGAPFYGLHQRIEDLTRHHEEQLETVKRLCATPQTAGQLLPHLYRRELKGIHLFLALSEALAHLEYLVDAGRLERRTTEEVVRYVAGASA